MLQDQLKTLQNRLLIVKNNQECLGKISLFKLEVIVLLIYCATLYNIGILLMDKNLLTLINIQNLYQKDIKEHLTINNLIGIMNNHKEKKNNQLLEKN